ncbi:WD40 repeat domain-containing protein [Pseudomonas rubra]|uniref:WD40 repeat domain-containing protein n=1 Tax=Pseudomonas rubra TaxID=2942627 RepID=A0ABT5PEK6_9PSED|nr:WD40 repeat domain-containing protein [Pseudomonas rubra]MDD1016577.1 WD40 repeat domain-containing protein [Pseudomonas rubra]MDD1038554.1 WD40 repeat domain-containing protein [Pseudomonas rubra]MDD1154754.1 WD40 repeat domain-containing protein [Pseudomonas rubra]
MKHIGPISGIAAHAAEFVATAGYDNQVILWNARTGLPIHRVHHDHLANQCAFSADGKHLVSASSDYTARIWEVPSMRLKAVLSGHQDDVEMAVFSPDGTQVATCSRDHVLRIFDLNGNLKGSFHGHQADVISVVWSPDGKRLISSSDDGTVRQWDTASLAQCDEVDIGGVETDTIAITRNGVVFAGDDEGRISIIGQGQVRSIAAHDAGIKRIVWNDDKQLLVTLSYDRSAILWRLDEQHNLSKLRSTALPSIIWPRSCAFVGEQELVFATFGSRYATWNYERDQWSIDGIQPAVSINAVVSAQGQQYSIGDAGLLFRDNQPLTGVGSLCNFLLPFGPLLLTGGQMGQVFDALSGELLYQHRSPLNCGATFEKNGVPHALIGTYTGEGLVFILDGRAGLKLVASIAMHDNAIKGVAANDRYLFSVCASADAALHRIDDFSCARHIDNAHSRISNGCCQIDGGFASIGRDLKLRLWLDGGDEVYDSPHQHSIKCIGASADGAIIATAAYNGTVALFDLATRSWQPLQRPTAAGISCITHSGQQHDFLASSYDGNIYGIAARRAS